MSKKVLVIFIVVAVLLVAFVAFWAGRSRSGDNPRASRVDPDDHSWTKALEGGAGAIGGLFGKGPSEFDMARLRESDGRRLPDCRTRCEYDISGSASLRVSRDRDARHAKFFVRGSTDLTVNFRPNGVELDEEPEDTTLVAGKELEITVLEDGGRLTLSCPTGVASCAATLRRDR